MELTYPWSPYYSTGWDTNVFCYLCMQYCIFYLVLIARFVLNLKRITNLIYKLMGEGVAHFLK